jgi:hypothetical protein
MKKIFSFLIIIGLITFTSNLSFAQYENTSGKKQEGTVKKRQKPPKQNRWFAGGMIGAGFSSYSSYVEVAPIVGFKVTQAFHVGTRLTYIFNSYTFNYGLLNERKVQLHHYGISLFGRYVIWKGLFAHAEYEALSFDQDQFDRYWVNSLFLGGGFLQNIGGRGFMSFAILFNVLDNEYSPYTNPSIRIGFGVGF